LVSSDKEHDSLPRLYGAPAHTPRRFAAALTERPLGPDDLPIENLRTAEESALASELFAREFTRRAIGVMADPETTTPTVPGLRPRPLRLRALAGRLLRANGH